MSARPRTKLAAVATAITRLLLLLWPSSVRRDLGGAMVGDVRRSAQAMSGVRAVPWLMRLSASLLLNAVAAWLGWPRSGGRRASPGGAPWRARRMSAISWLDIRLGVRMLLKYPALTLVGGLGIAVAIGASAGFFAFAYGMFYPTIPLEEGHRLVGLENWDLERNNEERRSLHDFVLWREEMTSVEDLSAFRTVSRNLDIGEGGAELIRIAEMTPSGFTLARVPPLLGRTLTTADAGQDAPEVLVIGHRVWRTRFNADPGVVGREVRLGRVVHTIVGVMPEGFAFPMNHSYWIPFRERPEEHPLGGGPSIFISGRLAPGHALEDAKSELTVIGNRMAAEFPDTHARMRAQVMPYAYPLVDINESGGEGFLWAFTAMNATISSLLLLVGLNIGVLVYARTASRRGEIAVRTALGASRGRIVGQLFAESLVLSVAGAAAGLLLARVGTGIGNQIMAMEVAESPFWMDLSIPMPAVAYVVFLTILTAVITGVIPGLQATGKRVQANLSRYHSGVGLHLGRTWTTLIVVQVAVTVAGLPLAVAAGWGEVSSATTRPTYEVDRFLAVSLATDEEGLAQPEAEAYRQGVARHLTDVRTELLRRLAAEPGVVTHTALVDIPGRGSLLRIVLEDDAAGDGSNALDEATGGAGGNVADDTGSGRSDGFEVRSSRVHAEFFAAFDIALLTGRALRAEDFQQAARDVVVVDRTFVRTVLGGGNALGRRLRLVANAAEAEDVQPRWFQIVGVVDDLHENLLDEDLLEPHVYRPARTPSAGAVRMAIRVADIEPLGLSGLIRETAFELDPTLRVVVTPLTQIYRQEQLALMLVGLVLALVAASVLLLSAAGIYALMAFTVSQRRREIGIRTALGASRRRLLGGIFGRALAQLGSGVTLGVAVALLLNWQSGGEAFQGRAGVLLTAVVVVMAGVGILSAMGPTRRGLRVQPTEALGAD